LSAIPRFRPFFQSADTLFQFDHLQRLADAFGQIDYGFDLRWGNLSPAEFCGHSRKELWHVGNGCDLREPKVDGSVLFQGDQAFKASRAVGPPRSARRIAEEWLPQGAASL